MSNTCDIPNGSTVIFYSESAAALTGNVISSFSREGVFMLNIETSNGEGVFTVSRDDIERVLSYPKPPAPPRLGELKKGEMRLVGSKTLSFNQNERGLVTVIDKFEVQVPYSGGVVDFKIKKEFDVNTPEKEKFSVDFGGEPTSEEQFVRWLKAAAFALEVKDQIEKKKEITIYL